MLEQKATKQAIIDELTTQKNDLMNFPSNNPSNRERDNSRNRRRDGFFGQHQHPTFAELSRLDDHPFRFNVGGSAAE